MITRTGLRPNPPLRRPLRRRGQPLVALGVILGGWAAVRVCALTLLPNPLPIVEAKPPVGAAVARSAFPPALSAAVPRVVKAVGPAPVQTTPSFARLPAPQAAIAPPIEPLRPAPPYSTEPVQPLPTPTQPVQPATQPDTRPVMQPSARLRLAGGHQALWLAALGEIALPPEFARLRPAVAADSPQPRGGAKTGQTPARWSADGWLMLRQGGGPAPTGAFTGSYGASQAGAVLRYRLAPRDDHKPTAYLRASAALGSTREQEVAAGLSARPLGRLPVVAMAELRAARSAFGTRIRPAAALVTELPSLHLPAGLRAEAYAQAGYVGGVGATAFVDGQVRLERKLFDLASHELRAGAGAWGGAQRGASRLDVGPSASVVLRLGDAGAARLAMDWRFRVAGKAAPASGPAVTLSAGF